MELLEVKSIVTEMKNDFNSHVSRLNTAEKTISELENRSIRIIQIGIKMGKSENPRDVGQNQSNIHIIGI